MINRKETVDAVLPFDKMTINRMLYFAMPLVFIGGIFLGGFLKKPVVITEKPETPIIAQNLPECFGGRCPTYESLDTDGDGLVESVVTVPTAMTKGAGKIVIIDDGKISFDSGEYPGISIVDSGPGEFSIEYSEDFGQIGNDLRSRIKYKFRDGHYYLSE